LEYISLSEE
jgi:hypothetical protein